MNLGALSLSARRAWIEIDAPSSAPYAELVALRKESVDRNDGVLDAEKVAKVALRKESVDRNGRSLPVFLLWGWSLSARRAWIEIWASGRRGPGAEVALRKESVDRNFDNGIALIPHQVALRKESVDRNLATGKSGFYGFVALRKESVDRNLQRVSKTVFR